MTTRFKNVRLLRQSELIWDDLWVDNDTGMILDPMERFYNASKREDFVAHDNHRVVDCHGMIAAPGFIDLQCNGGYGVDFSDYVALTPEKVRMVANKLLETGVTSFCPTLISCKPTQYRKLIPLIQAVIEEQTTGKPSSKTRKRKRKASYDMANILGLHLEGPFFAKTKTGAHNSDYVAEPRPSLLGNGEDWEAWKTIESFYGADLEHISFVTLAPELPGSFEVIETLTKKYGIKVSLGHSTAKLNQAEEGFKRGATMITHLFNAMGGFHHRDPGIIGLLGIPKCREKVYYGMIVDGLHCHPSSVCIAYESHPKGLCLVTDAIAAMGLCPGEHKLGTVNVHIKSGELDYIKGLKAVVANTDTLAGSVATMDQCIRNFRRFTKCTIEQALEAASLRPAMCAGIAPEQGTLDFGAIADFVLLDEDLNVHATYLRGKLVYSSKEQ